jgi:hypothetical protein
LNLSIHGNLSIDQLAIGSDFGNFQHEKMCYCIVGTYMDRFVGTFGTRVVWTGSRSASKICTYGTFDLFTGKDLNPKEIWRVVRLFPL